MSSTVRDLVAGSGLRFDDRGTRQASQLPPLPPTCPRATAGRAGGGAVRSTTCGGRVGVVGVSAGARQHLTGVGERGQDRVEAPRRWWPELGRDAADSVIADAW